MLICVAFEHGIKRRLSKNFAVKYILWRKQHYMESSLLHSNMFSISLLPWKIQKWCLCLSCKLFWDVCSLLTESRFVCVVLFTYFYIDMKLVASEILFAASDVDVNAHTYVYVYIDCAWKWLSSLLTGRGNE